MYASAGSGTSTYLAAALFEHLARIKLTHGHPTLVTLLPD